MYTPAGSSCPTSRGVGFGTTSASRISWSVYPAPFGGCRHDSFSRWRDSISEATDRGCSDHGSANHELYLLDGQQRLTSLYQALRSPCPVKTRDRPGGNRVIKRWYYLDMQAGLDPFADPEDVIISVPEDWVERRNFGREIVLDLSSTGLGIPATHDADRTDQGQHGLGFEYAQHWNACSAPHPHGNAFEFFMRFQNAVLNNFTSYQLPVINLDRYTSKEAVCTVFEKVNTGGVTSTCSNCGPLRLRRTVSP